MIWIILTMKLKIVTLMMMVLIMVINVKDLNDRFDDLNKKLSNQRERERKEDDRGVDVNDARRR